MRFVGHISISGVSIGLHRFFQKLSQLKKIVLKVKENANNDVRNQAIGVLNAGMSATVVSRHFGCTQKTTECSWRQLHVTGNVDCPRSGRLCVTIAANDCYIVLQHVCNRRLTAATTRRQYGIHPQTVRNRLRQND